MTKQTYDVPEPFDRYFRLSMKKPEIAIPFCQTHLPKPLVSKINFSTLRFINRSFLNEELRKFACDVILEFELNPPDDSDNQTPPDKLSIAVIIEHQSTPDKFMAFRMMHYMFCYLNEQFTQRKSKSTQLNPVFPLLFYNGPQSPYPYSLDFYDSFNDPHGVMKQVFNSEIKVIDVNLLEESKLKTQQLLGIMTRAMKFRNITEQAATYLTDLFIDLHLTIANSDDTSLNNLKDYTQSVITYLASISDVNELRQAIEENDKIPKNVRGEYMTAAEYFIQQGKELGIIKGKELGIIKGKELGIIKGKKLGIIKGKELGIIKGHCDVATKALAKGFNIETVVDLTGLDIKVVEQLKNDLEAQ